MLKSLVPTLRNDYFWRKEKACRHLLPIWHYFCRNLNLLQLLPSKVYDSLAAHPLPPHNHPEHYEMIRSATLACIILALLMLNPGVDDSLPTRERRENVRITGRRRRRRYDRPAEISARNYFSRACASRSNESLRFIFSRVHGVEIWTFRNNLASVTVLVRHIGRCSAIVTTLRNNTLRCVTRR